jgi:uncharacterized protein (TIGR02246 family)
MTPSMRAGSDREAIQSQIDRFAAAWNSHDPKAMSMMFAEDGDLINPFGQVAKSRAEIEKLFQEEQAKGLKDTRFSLQTERVQFPAQNLAIGDYAFEITGAKDESGQGMTGKGHLTLVFQKHGSSWEVLAARPMIPAPRP